MKNALILFLMLIYSICNAQSFTVNATNTRFELVNGQVKVYYDVPAELKGKTVYILTELKRTGDASYSIIPKPSSLSGNITNSTYKYGTFTEAPVTLSFNWDYLKDVPQGLSGDDFYFVVTFKEYNEAEETLKDRLFDFTVPGTGQKVTIECPAESGNIIVHKGASILTASYPELMTGDQIYWLGYVSTANKTADDIWNNSSGKKVKNCNELNAQIINVKNEYINSSGNYAYFVVLIRKNRTYYTILKDGCTWYEHIWPAKK